MTMNNSVPQVSAQATTPAADVASDEQRAAADPAASMTTALDAAVGAERQRTLDIQRVARTLGVVELGEEHVKKGTTAAKFREIAIDAHEKRTPLTGPRGSDSPSNVVPGEDARDKYQRGAAAWIYQRAGVTHLIADAAKREGKQVDLDPGEFRGLTFLDLARQALERNGVRTAGMDKMQLMGAALTMRAGGYMTTGDFPVLLETALNKTLLAAYATAPDTWREFSAIGSVSDFRPHTRYRQGSFGRLTTVNEHGEFKNAKLNDGAKESISATTKGNIVGITRQALINDDMGAFSDMATRLGRAARLSIELDVYDLILLNAGLGPVMSDGFTLYHANHANIGTAAALSAAALDADRNQMAVQKDLSNNEILDIRPAILLVPIGLGTTATMLNTAPFSILPNQFQTPNTANGMFQKVIASPRITGTRRYMFADPNVAPTIEVVFLDGQQTPYLETKDGWRIDGTEWKVRLDYGIGAVDWRPTNTNAGA